MTAADGQSEPTSPVFSWRPLFRELAGRVLEFRDRQDELIRVLRTAQEKGASVISLKDQDASGQAVPLAEIDPFTFFASVCRVTRQTERRRTLQELKTALGLSAPIPDDFDGVPLVNNQSSWFISYAHRRKEQDVPTLWEIASAALRGGAEALDNDLWERCLRIRQVGLAKLTMGLFWIAPDNFLALDGKNRASLAARGVPCQVENLDDYRAFLQVVRDKVGTDFAQISWDAYQYGNVSAEDGGAGRTRCWAGGHNWSSGSRLPEFLAESAWWHGYSRGDTSSEAVKVWTQFDQIAVGDRFAIKGYGGRNDLKIYYAGRVIGKEDAAGKVLLEPLPTSAPRSIRPGPGFGSWFGTLQEVTDPALVRWMFDNVPYQPHTTNSMPNTPLPPLNQILYGPPGTGKTYSTRKRAVDILGPFPPISTGYQSDWDELREAGRIEFVTFHQSYSYEDFIEGLRPVLDDDGQSARYEIRSGVLKEVALRAIAAALEPVQSAAASFPFSALWEAFLNEVAQDPDAEYEGLSDASRYRLEVTPRGNLWGRNTRNPDAGRYYAGRDMIAQVFAAYQDRDAINTTDVQKILRRNGHHMLTASVFREMKRLGNRLQTSQGPVVAATVPAAESAMDYLKRREASGFRLKPEGSKLPRFILVIDEINRGNMSKVFGELITLLEEDKRLGEENELIVTLPYSRDPFALPANLYLLGTMNTADKSIALVDVALRRRFEFEELRPDFSVCGGLTEAMEATLIELNRRIALRKDRDHRIGHAYFIHVTDEAGFNRVFEKKILPLLSEYFYGDWEGLRYVLGDRNETSGFIRKAPGSEAREARNRWQWYFDEDAGGFAPFSILQQNYALPSGAGD